jgi:two-component system, NtrC family, sensor kinase
MRNIMHSLRAWFRSSIKLRVLSIIGVVVSVLMIIISISILHQWRALIIGQETNNAKSIATAFSIPVIETMILADDELGSRDDLLISHVQNFRDNVEGIVYISIQDNSHRILAHSDLSQYGNLLSDPGILAVSRTREVLTSISEHPDHGWMLEILQPLQIGEKRWGTVLMGFDAAHIREQVRSAFFQLLGLTMVAMFVTIGLLYFFISRVLASLRDLVTEVDKIDLNSDDTIALPDRSDEIGFLIDHFEMMKKRLAQSRIDLEKAQNQIFQAEKLASIGRLASGVAHEVNNPLNGMRFCVFGIKKDLDNREQTVEYLNMIDDGLNQIESVVTKLLGYARQRPKEPQHVDMVKQLSIVRNLLEYRLNEKNIKMNIRVDDDLPPVQADPNLMQEMLMNLLLNSLDAVDEEGEISVDMQAAGGKMVIRVQDNGTGISEKELKMIFEPFYSTKETGKGTGLGLSVTHGIVESHNGTISVTSRFGEYTEFTIMLPLETEHATNMAASD